MGTADPHEQPSLPALQYAVSHWPSIVRTEAPVRVYDDAAADPDWTPRPVGFAPPAPAPVDRDPLLWDGDQA